MTTVPVLVVGGGPAGLTASLLLSRHGIRSLLVDRHESDAPLPRARGVHARAMEIMRVLGVDGPLRERELPITPGARWLTAVTEPPVREERITAAVEDDVSPSEGLSQSQDVFEAVLRERAASCPPAQLRRGTVLESLEPSGDGATAVLRDRRTGVVSEVTARYVIAADGARSGIRAALGIGTDGPEDLGEHVMVAFRADLSAYLGEHPWGIHLLVRSGGALIWTHPDHRWVLNLPAAAAAGDGPAALVAGALGLPGPVEVLGHNRWRAAACVATRFRQGPVFLAGDAAHRVPPGGATGVSTAVHDVHNLAWKLAAVLRGEAPDALLDSYEAERRPVCVRTAGETEAAWRRLTDRSLPPFAARSMRQLDFGFQYRSAAVTPDGSDDADPPGADYVPTGAPGCRAPHVWLDRARTRSTIDLFDTRFVLLTGPDGSGWRAAGRVAAAELGLALDRPVVGSPQVGERYGIGPTGAVLVRPDGHVAWRCPDGPEPGSPELHLALRAATGHGAERRTPPVTAPTPA